MSDTNPPSEEEIEEFEKQLKQDTAESRREQEQQKEALLESVKSDDDLGGEDTVQIGGMEVRHKSYIPGRQLKKLRRARQLMESGGELPDDDNDIELLCEITEALHDTQTNETVTDDETIELFWKGFLDEYGTDAHVVIEERLLAPIVEATEEKMSGLQSFPAE